MLILMNKFKKTKYLDHSKYLNNQIKLLMELDIQYINAYFKNLKFKKVDMKENFVIYAALIDSMIGSNIKRYVFAFVPSHLAIKDQGYIHELNWKNIQTRSLQKNYKNLKKQRWNPPRIENDLILQVKERSQRFSRYFAPNFPFDVLLVHEPKVKSVFQYNNKITLAAAIETFNFTASYINTPQTVNLPTSNNELDIDHITYL